MWGWWGRWKLAYLGAHTGSVVFGTLSGSVIVQTARGRFALSYPLTRVCGMDFFENQGDNRVLTVDCGTCVMQATAACEDCVVSFICDREPDDAVVINMDELRTMRALSQAGLVPGLKHRSSLG